ncbi:hypothetical protein [Hymenobacter sp. B81]|uniref:hypothetical protein n=1 Tax=Hymenobacter sp. B81 TaxID=3344878 RepID=UPI0037DC4CB4
MLIVLILFSIPLYLFWLWLFSKRIIFYRNRVLISLFTTLITLFTLGYGFIVFLYGNQEEEVKLKFSSTKWFEEKNTRFLMADDIIHSKLLLRKDTIHIKEILGEPNHRTESSFVYHLGMSGKISMIFHKLEIKYEHNQVNEIKHIETPE